MDQSEETPAAEITRTPSTVSKFSLASVKKSIGSIIANDTAKVADSENKNEDDENVLETGESRRSSKISLKSLTQTLSKLKAGSKSSLKRHPSEKSLTSIDGEKDGVQTNRDDADQQVVANETEEPEKVLLIKEQDTPVENSSPAPPTAGEITSHSSHEALIEDALAPVDA